MMRTSRVRLVQGIDRDMGRTPVGLGLASIPGSRAEDKDGLTMETVEAVLSRVQCGEHAKHFPSLETLYRMSSRGSLSWGRSFGGNRVTVIVLIVGIDL